MAYDIGEAKVQLKVDLETLRNDLLQASKEVDKFLESAGKDIKIDISSDNLSGITDSFKKVGDSMEGVKANFTELADSSQQSFGIVNSIVDETANKVFGAGSVMSAATKGIAADVGAMGISFGTVAVAAGGVTAILVVLGAEIYALVKFVGDVIDKTKEYISQNSELQSAIKSVKDAVTILTEGLGKIYDALRDRLAGAIVDTITGLVNTWNEMNRTTGAGNELLDALKRLMTSGFELVMRVVDAVVKVFNSFSGSSDDSKNKVDSLTTAVQTLSSILNGFAFVFEKVALGIQIVGDAASKIAGILQPVIETIREILSGLAKIANSGLGSLFGKGNYAGTGDDSYFQTGKEVRGEENYTDYGVEAGPGNLDGKNKFNQYYNNQKSGSSGSTETKEKEIDLEKEEKKLLDEIIDGYENKLRLINESIPLGEATVRNLNTELQNYREALEVKKQSLSYESNIYDAQLKIQQVKNDILNISEREKKAQEEILQKAGKEAQQIKEDMRERIQLEAKAEEELKRLQVKNTGDISKMKLFEIDRIYDEEEKRIRAAYKETDKVEKLIAELKKAKQKEIEVENLKSNQIIFGFLRTGYDTTMNFVMSGFNNVWNTVFGEANSLFEMLIQNIYNQLLELAASSIFKSIINLLSGGAAGGILGFIGSLFGVGGFTGTGDDDEPAGVVHRNEFVVNPKGALIPDNRIFLELMNQGMNIKKIFQENFSFPLPTALPDISGLNFSGSAGRGGDNIINLGGIKNFVKNNSLSGLDDNKWSKIVDDEIIPQVSRGLKRIGKEFLDNSINI